MLCMYVCILCIYACILVSVCMHACAGRYKGICACMSVCAYMFL